MYEDRATGKKLIGKFFLTATKNDAAKAVSHLTRGGQQPLRDARLGTDGKSPPGRQTSGRQALVERLLVTECFEEVCSAKSSWMPFRRRPRRTVCQTHRARLFLSEFHKRTATGLGVDFNQDCDYLDIVIGRLLAISALAADQAAELYVFRDRWRKQPRMWQDQQVIVHGDATPSFMFGPAWKS
ncbi:MAG: hypothetical protein IPK39_24060 [Sulfuritalea sp.]|nr:hypothetical protein [Sulfuritalea sp.]